MDSDSPDHQEYHPDFCDVIEESDKAVVLRSSDKVNFRVNKTFLRASSEFFATLLSLNQPEGSGEVIDCLEEDSTTIERILRIITGKEYPELSTIQEVAPIALTAEKWLMSGISSFIRMILYRDPTFASTTPLELYCLGCRLKWDEVAKAASKHTCARDLYKGPNLHPALSGLDPVDLWRLIWFHRERRNKIEGLWRDRASSICSVSWCDFKDSRWDPLMARGLVALLGIVEKRPVSRPPTRSDIQGKISRAVKGFDCPSCKLNHAASNITDFILEEWPKLPQTV